MKTVAYLVRSGRVYFGTILAVTAIGLSVVTPLRAQPVFSDGGPDAASYGQGAAYPSAPQRAGVNAQPYMVGSYSHYDAIYPAHTVAKAASPSTWQRSGQDLAVSYSYQNGTYSCRTTSRITRPPGC